jgi:hypothetical protein
VRRGLCVLVSGRVIYVLLAHRRAVQLRRGLDGLRVRLVRVGPLRVDVRGRLRVRVARHVL